MDVAAMTLGESPYTSTTVGEETTDTAVTAAMTTINKYTSVTVKSYKNLALFPR